MHRAERKRKRETERDLDIKIQFIISEDFLPCCTVSLFSQRHFPDPAGLLVDGLALFVVRLVCNLHADFSCHFPFTCAELKLILTRERER